MANHPAVLKITSCKVKAIPALINPIETVKYWKLPVKRITIKIIIKT